MHDDLAKLVHAILLHGIRLKQRLVAGDKLVLHNEQAVLKRMLLTDIEARRIPEYGEDDVANGSHFLGVRYALVCWLDEMFLIDSPWEALWNENKLELSLYGTNDRAWRFWEQAKLAEGRPGCESLMAFFLGVMLGFRGDLREDPVSLKAWIDAVRRRLAGKEQLAWTRPPERELSTYVPPLRGRESLRRMVVACGTLLLVLVPVLAVFFVQFMSQNAPSAPVPTPKSGQQARYGSDVVEPAPVEP